jgi:hypothetical protein
MISVFIPGALEAPSDSNAVFKSLGKVCQIVSAQNEPFATSDCRRHDTSKHGKPCVSAVYGCGDLWTYKFIVTEGSPELLYEDDGKTIREYYSIEQQSLRETYVYDPPEEGVCNVSTPVPYLKDQPGGALVECWEPVADFNKCTDSKAIAIGASGAEVGSCYRCGPRNPRCIKIFPPAEDIVDSRGIGWLLVIVGCLITICGCCCAFCDKKYNCSAKVPREDLEQPHPAKQAQVPLPYPAMQAQTVQPTPETVPVLCPQPAIPVPVSNVVQVAVPPGAPAGTTIQIQTLKGPMNVVVPSGINEGQTFAVQI